MLGTQPRRERSRFYCRPRRLNSYFHTWSAQKGAKGFELSHGEGVNLFEPDGTAWLDLGSLSYQAHLGFSNERMVAAIRKQVGNLAIAPPNASFAGKEELARSLLELAPSLASLSPSFPSHPFSVFCCESFPHWSEFCVK